ncbi:CCA tRNA nucleotidyltransferase, mitochondrial [Lecanora helva]
MAQILLTDQEASLRELLLDVSTYIGTLDGYTTPELRFTGGWVRDKLLGSTSVDIDIGIDTMTGYNFGTLMKEYLLQPETRAKYNQDVLGSLAKIEAKPDKSKHLETVTTRILGFDVDLVNLRKETYLEHSRNPLMTFGTPEEDALRRDATVNALFYNLSSSKVEDLTGRGLEDMKCEVIKTPLAPLQTFRDDPLRVLRAIRFASRLGFDIAPEDAEAMSDHSIKDALRLKISRERIGTEIRKMLKGLMFLCKTIDTARWSCNYNHLWQIVTTNSESKDPVRVNGSQLYRSVAPADGLRIQSPSLQAISRILLRNAEETYWAWTLVCFVPWAREQPEPAETFSAKRPPSLASIAAREGIKADNKITKLVNDAVSCLAEIVAIKDLASNGRQPTSAPSETKSATLDRVTQGLAIRSWGANWRSSIMYAILTQLADHDRAADRQSTLDDYAAWLLDLESSNLLEVDQLKPIVHGDELKKALKMGTGPWIKKALNMTIEWQLRNPDQTESADAISEVEKRKVELHIF